MDVLFPELKGFFKGSITGKVVRHLLEAYATPERVAAAVPADLYEVVVRKGRARRHAGRMDELQELAAGSAGLVDDVTHGREQDRLPSAVLDDASLGFGV